jgi:hypothetical protein
MTWYQEPEVRRTTEDGVNLWKLSGDWTRDLPLDVRRRASAELKVDLPEKLILDLADVKFIDSWGEETICDLFQQILDIARHVVWVWDPSRPSEYEGLKHALERRRLEVAGFSDGAEALHAAKSAR